VPLLDAAEPVTISTPDIQNKTIPMEFITKRVVRNQEVVLIDEIIDRIDKKILELLLKSGNLRFYKIRPADYGDTLWDYKIDYGVGEYLEKVQWEWSELSVSKWSELSEPVYVLVKEVEPLLFIPSVKDESPIETLQDEKTPDVQNGTIQDVKFLRDVIKESIKAEMEAGRVDKMPGAVKTETVKAAPQTKAERMAEAEALAKSLLEDAKNIWAIVRKFRNPQQIHKAVEAAVAYINEHPTTKFEDDDFSPEILKYDRNDPRRAIFKAIQSVLVRHGYRYKNRKPMLGLAKIKKLFSKR
jgi:hypothetical protein